VEDYTDATRTVLKKVANACEKNGRNSSVNVPQLTGELTYCTVGYKVP